MKRPGAMLSRLARVQALLCLLVIGAAGHAANQDEALSQASVDQKPGAQVPLALRFTNSEGKKVSLAQLIDGKPTLLELAWYSCPNLCDLSLRRLGSQLSDVKYRPGEDYQVVTVSIDPGEGPRQAAHARRMLDQSYHDGDGGGRWHVLTGDRAAIDKLAAAIGFRYQYHAASGQFAHPAGLAVLTGAGKVSSYLLGLLFDGHDLQLALTHAAKGELGSVTDQIVLRCFHFDPAKGVYTLDVLRVLNIACLLTVLVLAILIGGLFWRRRVHGGRADD